MGISRLINLGLMAVGAVASAGTLRRRHAWEQANRRAAIVLDYDDALAVSTRAGMPLADFLVLARQHGATHISLPELTLNRLLGEGRLKLALPAATAPAKEPARPPVYLASAEFTLIDHLACELQARLPSIHAHTLTHAHTHTLALEGHLPTLAEVGLGFEAHAAAEAINAGLGVVPRPVSFAWPEDHLVERTLAQAAGLQASIVAFDGDLILGHEMHLDATVAAMLRYELSLAYFCETRHQKGDWFVAKRLAPYGQVILAHHFTPAALVPEDFHSAAHHWGMLARRRGIRLCYVNVFRRIHATEPLDCLHYLEHIRKELEGAGLAFDEAGRTPPLPAPRREELAGAGLVSAGAASLAATEVLELSEPAALGVTALAAAGAFALPYLDRPRGTLEAAYPPSYAPKLLALAGAATAPIAAMSGNLAAGALIQAATAASLSALTAGQDYALRIEEYRSLNLDLWLPLAAVILRKLEEARWRWVSLAVLGATWYAARKPAPDVLDQLDRDLPAGHTHHLSAAQRLIGDVVIGLGPQPGRKWAGLGLAGFFLADRLRQRGYKAAALVADLLGTAASAMLLAAFRQPERPLAQTLPSVAKSWAVWAPAALSLAALLDGAPNNRPG